jgi:peptidoglycan/LPS O-acetylase OafA/YrhL
MWTLLTAGIRTVVGDAANHGAPTLQEIALGLVWQPINQYWYLPALLLSTISVVLLRRVFPPPWSAAGPVVVAVAMWIAGGYLDVGMFQFLHWTIYVAIGAAAGPAIGAVSGWATGRLWGTFAAGVAGFVLAVLVLAPTGALAVEVHVAFLLCAVLGVTWMLALAALVDRTIAGKPVAQVGTWSLHVFLMHVIFYAGSRIMLRSVGVSSPILLVVAGVIAGVGGPCLVAWLALRSLWTRWLFDPPMLRHDLHTRSSARVAEVGSFADAGQREPVLHPSLSTSLDQLEALSADLVDRGSQAVRGCGDRSRDRFRDQATDGCRDADPGAHCCGSVGLRDHG